MDADLDALATAFHVAADDLLTAHPERVPYRPRIGISPRIADAEVMTLALMQALPGFTSEAWWLRHVGDHVRGMFPMCRGNPGITSDCVASAGGLPRVLLTLGV